MTREDVERIIAEARKAGETPDLRGADLSGADLHEASLRWADLRGASLRWADLSWADLSGANLRGANLRGAKGDVVTLPESPSGPGFLAPTPDGWRVTIGCWKHRTLNDLRVLVTDPDAEWPEATGDERERRRPILAGILAFCDAYAAYHADTVPALAERWGS